MKALLSIVVGFLLALPVAAELPDIGSSAGGVISPVTERRIGEAMLRQLRQQHLVIEDPELNDYIQALGDRLAEHAEGHEGRFTFFLVDDPQINAFAAPGGFIGVHSGLILNTRSESELASVIAHEIAHVTQHHLARTFEEASQMSLPVAAAMIGAILVAAVNPQAGQAALAAVQAGSIQHQLNFTRANEEEADRIGIRILDQASYDPFSMPAFFQRLQTAYRYTDSGRIPEFLRTHPVTTNRIADSISRAEQLGRRESEENPDYWLARARLTVLAGRDDPPRLVRTFEAALREGSFLDETAARYGYAEALLLAGELGRAQLQVTALLRQDPARPAFLLQQARLLMTAGEFAKAAQVYAALVEEEPRNRAAVLAWVEALLRMKQPDRAREILTDYALKRTPGPLYHQLYAQTMAAQGHPVEARIAMAEHHYLLGDTKRAVAFLERALREGGMSNYQRQRIEARLVEFREELAAQEKLAKEGP